MAWFSKAFDGKIERHDQKMWAIFRCNVAASDGQMTCHLGVYKRDPLKYEGEPNLLPGLIAAAAFKGFAKDVKAIERRSRK